MVDTNIRAIERRATVPHTQLDKLEHDLRNAAVPSRADDFSKDPFVEDLGKMSAEAVLTQYETAAREFEIMGDEVKDRIEKLKASLEEADASMKLLTEAAKAIREKGKLAHAQIEEMSSVAKAIHELHSDVMKKIIG